MNYRMRAVTLWLVSVPHFFSIAFTSSDTVLYMYFAKPEYVFEFFVCYRFQQLCTRSVDILVRVREIEVIQSLINICY